MLLWLLPLRVPGGSPANKSLLRQRRQQARTQPVPGVDHRNAHAQVTDALLVEVRCQRIERRLRRRTVGQPGQCLGPAQRRAFAGIEEAAFVPGGQGVQLAWLDARLADVTPARFAELSKIFRDATRLEIDFWQMGLDLSE